MRIHLLCLIALGTLAYGQSARLERTVSGQTLKSASDPAIQLTFDPAFHYAGAQVIDIFHVAGAEQHFFVDAGPDKQIKRFYWIQFEHYYPSNAHTYDYGDLKPLPTKLGGLTFVADTAARDNYFSMDDRAGSDSEATRNFLAAKGYKFGGAFVRSRMFALPDASKRKELMIIYGELIPNASASGEKEKQNLQHAQEFVVLSPK